VIDPFDPEVSRADGIESLLHEPLEILDGQPGLLEDVGKSGALDWPMRWHDQLQRFLRRMLLEPNVASALANDDPAVPTECPNHVIVVQGSGPS
jgi:hypothetical protein